MLLADVSPTLFKDLALGWQYNDDLPAKPYKDCIIIGEEENAGLFSEDILMEKVIQFIKKHPRSNLSAITAGVGALETDVDKRLRILEDEDRLDIEIDRGLFDVKRVYE
jgi:hypothetical protein